MARSQSWNVYSIRLTSANILFTYTLRKEFAFFNFSKHQNIKPNIFFTYICWKFERIEILLLPLLEKLQKEKRERKKKYKYTRITIYLKLSLQGWTKFTLVSSHISLNIKIKTKILHQLIKINVLRWHINKITISTVDIDCGFHSDHWYLISKLTASKGFHITKLHSLSPVTSSRTPCCLGCSVTLSHFA